MSARLAKKKQKKEFNRNLLEEKLNEASKLNEKYIDRINVLSNLDTKFNSLSGELIEVKGKLRNAQLKYREITQSNSSIKEKNEKLISTNKKLLDEVSTHAIARADYKDVDTRDQSLAKEVLRLKMALNERDVDLAQSKLETMEARQSAVRIKNTLSFRLGYELIFGFKSAKGLIGLPKKLFSLRTEAKSRRISQESVKSLGTETLKLEVFDSNRSPVRLKEQGDQKLSEVLKSLRVASVMDEFTYNSFLPECNLFGLTPQNWQKELEAFKPEVVFIESAWRGKLDLWGAKVGHMSQEIVDIAQWCRDNNVPSLFWNKEDPVHFETFLNTARLFDYIFTTDIDCVARYKTALQHDNVFFLPFAAQPKNNNPIEKYERKDAFCFAGAYYKKYPERTKDLGNFVLSLPEFKPLEIYDRNFGKTNPEYMFPSEYQPYIMGTLSFDEIDKAYKGYNYAINLNSIKQSQSMFARRVFELLASNTITVSNFSKGLKSLFGDLVFTSDSGFKITDDLKRLSSSETEMKKFRLLALRKVLSEHTYQDRMSYIYSKLTGEAITQLLPTVYVFSYAKDQAGFDQVYEQFKRQSYNYKELLVVTPKGTEIKSEDNKITISTADNADKFLREVANSDWIATFVKEDFYDEYYLEDLLLATRYTNVDVIGKANYYKAKDHDISLHGVGSSYKPTTELLARTCIVKVDKFIEISTSNFIRDMYTLKFSGDCFSIDEFSYCMAGCSVADATKITKLPGEIDQGLNIYQLNQAAEKKTALKSEVESLAAISAKALFDLIPMPKQSMVTVCEEGLSINVSSSLPDGKHEYWYANQLLTPESLGVTDGVLNLYLESDVGLNLQFVLFFMDDQGQRISHVIKVANRNHAIEIPVNTLNIKFGLRIYASGETSLKQLYLQHKPTQPLDIIQKSETLLITNNYPCYDDLYKNAFVHSRVKGYKSANKPVDVWRFKNDAEVSFHEFEGVDVTTGGADYLAYVLKTNQYKHILVHFLDDAIWQVINNHLADTKVTVWLHGADIQSYERRAFMYDTDDQKLKAKQAGDIKQSFWRSVLNPFHENLHLVFVSNYLADTAMEDLGISLEPHQYSIIPNPIDTDLFNYIKKPVAQRKKILSIRPYASKVYANDLAVKAVLELSKERFFEELEFRFIGDGPLFEDTLAPLRQFDNVIIEQKFLSRLEIADLHKQYGVFLCPSRMDTQGVSRDEAMASGLIPITNAVAAIPEFVNTDWNILADGESYMELVKSIKNIVNKPDLFNYLNREVVDNIFSTRSSLIVNELEIGLLGG